MRIGIVDLDTSHPQNWIPHLRDLGHEIVGVWDGGAVHPPEYVGRFAEERDIPRVYDALTDLAADVDGAILHGCDWDTHVEKARPFVEAGKSVLIDKPLAGNLTDLRQIRSWAQDGARIAGGSSLRFCVEVGEWLARPTAERGTPHTVFGGCGVDEFNYGIHAYALLCGVMGPGVRSVRHLGAGPQRRVELRWHDGRIGFLNVGAAPAALPFYLTVLTEQEVTHLRPDPGKLYRALLETTLPYLAGDTEKPAVPIDDLLEPELCACAAWRSWQTDDAEVRLTDLTEADGGYDGAAFARSYRKTRYPDAAAAN
jgi:hypothetical protein